jgi:hypothetical protein
MSREREKGRMEAGAMEFTLEELREFLEGDRLDVRADPEFKERLRRRLWDIVRTRTQRPGDIPD